MRRAARALAARPGAGRSAVLWAVIVALLVYGYAGTLLQIVGPMHRHASAPAAPPAVIASLAETLRHWHQQAQGLQVGGRHRQDSAAAWAFALQRMDDSDPAHAREHARGQPHTHDHARFERHYHDPSDGSVIALDAHGSTRAAVDGLAATAALGSAMLPLWAPQAALALTSPPGGYHAPRLQGAAPRWRNADVIQEDRPPRPA